MRSQSNACGAPKDLGHRYSIEVRLLYSAILHLVAIDLHAALQAEPALTIASDLCFLEFAAKAQFRLVCVTRFSVQYADSKAALSLAFYLDGLSMQVITEFGQKSKPRLRSYLLARPNALFRLTLHHSPNLNYERFHL